MLGSSSSTKRRCMVPIRTRGEIKKWEREGGEKTPRAEEKAEARVLALPPEGGASPLKS